MFELSVQSLGTAVVNHTDCNTIFGKYEKFVHILWELKTFVEVWLRIDVRHVDCSDSEM